MRAYTVRFTTPTSTGTTDLTVSGAGTCIGAIFKVDGALGDVSPTNGARGGHGATDGTNERAGAWFSANGGVTTNTSRRKVTTHCLLIVNAGGAVNGSATFDSFITDGIRLDVDDAFANAFFVEATLFFSDSAADEFFVGTGDTSSGNHTISSVGFEASFLFGFSTQQSSAGTGQDNAKFSVGFGLNDGTQNCLSFYEVHSGLDGAPSARVDSSYFLRDIENGSVNGAVQIGSFTSSGFTATQINGSGFEFYYVAVKCSNVVTLDLELSRNSTGSRSHTGPGGPPQFVCGWNSKIDALDTNYQDGRAGAFGFWQSHSLSAQYNSAIAIEDASAVTDTQSTVDDTFPFLPDHDGGTATAIIGAITSFHATGITVNYTTVDSVECYFSLLAIHLEDIFVDPDPGSASFLGVDPTVVQGSVSVDGGDAIATFLGVNPDTHQSSFAVTPAGGGSATFLGVDPDVDADEDAIKATMTAYETRLGNNFLFGTLPVPDTWVETALSLRNPETGFLVPTQQEVVVRGPTGNPQVLEIRAYASSDGAGGKTYKVEEVQTVSSLAFHNDITINIVADAPHSITDQGTITPFSSRLLNGVANGGVTGQVAQTIRRAGELQAFSGSRLFGYEAFITKVAGESGVWLIDMTVHNGNVGTPGSPLGSNALHDVFFNEIRLEFPGLTATDYEVRFLQPTPYAVNGAPGARKLMQPNANGSDHCIQIGQSHEYRFVVYHTSQVARAIVLLGMFGFMVTDFSKTKWSWNNRNTAHFGPGGTMVAEFNITNHLPYIASWTTIQSGLAGGNSFTTDLGPTTPAGPYHLYGPSDFSSTGGGGIYGHMGHEVVNATTTRLDRLNTLIAIQGMARDRHASKDGSGAVNFIRGTCLVDNAQIPIDPAQWNLNDVEITYPGEFNVNHDGPFSRHLADNWRLDLATSEGSLPSYYDEITGFSPPNFSHLIRGLNATFPLIWLANDRLAKSHLATMAAWSRMRSNEYAFGDLYAHWTDGLDDNTNPGKGLGGYGGRYGGWPVLVLAADYKVSSPSKRQNYMPWHTMNSDAHERGQLASGNWHVATSGSTPENDLDTQWLANGHPPGYQGGIDAAAGQAIEIGIHGYGMLAWEDALGSAVLQILMTEACRGLWQYSWWPGTGGPHFGFPVRPESSNLLPAWTTRYPGTGDPNGTPGGIAPDCFRTNTSPDNYQVAPLIYAALKGNPVDANAMSAIFAALGVSTVENAILQLQTMATNQEDKWCAGWNAVMAFLQDVVDNLLVTPPVGSAEFEAFSPTLFFSSTTASPAAGSASFLGVNPTVFVGGRIGPLDPAIFTANADDPTTVQGSVSVESAVAVATMLGVDPALVFSSTTALPAAGSATFLGVDPDVTMGSRTAAPDPGIVEMLAVDPEVILGSISISATATAAFLAVDPTTIHNSFTYAPEPAVVSFLAENPVIGQSIGVTPEAGVATFLAEDPAVVDYDAILVSSPVNMFGSITSVYATLRGRI